MSVHDDGAPRWQKKTPDNVPTDAWASVSKEADALLRELVLANKSITSLDFKVELRKRCAGYEPQPVVVQEDVSKYLKHWFLGLGAFTPGAPLGGGGSVHGYAFREHKTSEGKTYNEYHHDPEAAQRTEETRVEDEIVEAQKRGLASVWAWLKRRLHR